MTTAAADEVQLPPVPTSPQQGHVVRSVRARARTSHPSRPARPVLARVGAWLLVGLLAVVPSSMRVRGDDASACNICGESGGAIGRPDVVVQEPIGGTELTCADLQDRADAGEFNALQCTILQLSMSTPCGCTTPFPGQAPPSGSPVAPSSAPETNKAPTAAPAPRPSRAPSTPTSTSTGAPVQQSLSNLTSQLRIVFAGASGRMNGNLTSWFEQETCSFLEDQPPSEATGILSCQVLDQVLATGEAESGLDVRMQVLAQQSALGSGVELGNQLAAAITNNSDAYLAALSRPFFDDVTAVQAFADTDGEPTAAPTAAAVPSAPGSGSPVAGATTAPVPPRPSTNPVPTPRPTQPLVELSGRVDVRLEYLVGEMTGAIRASFENTTAQFLTAYLGTGSAPLLDIVARVLYQVAGEIPGPTGKPLTASLAVTGRRKVPMELDGVVAETLNTYGAEFIEALQSSPSAPAQIYFKTVLNVSAAVFDGLPAAAPTTAPISPEPSSGDGSSLSGGAIAGIVIGCLAFVAVVAFLVHWMRTDKAKPPSGSRHSAVALGSSPSDGPAPSTSYASSSPGRGGVAQRPSALKKAAIPPKSEEAPIPTSAAAAALAASAGTDAHDDSASSQAEEGAATTAAGAAMTLESNDDNDSFTYSLNDGLEPSQAPQRAAEPGSGAPTTVSSVSGGGGDSSMGGMSGVTSGATSGATASTASEDRLARKFKRTVIAPEGKLGIIIDTTVEGPIVYKVNANSPLEGVIFPGDLIVKIDDIETRAMSANNITTLMVQTAGQKRALTVLSDDPSR